MAVFISATIYGKSISRRIIHLLDIRVLDHILSPQAPFNPVIIKEILLKKYIRYPKNRNDFYVTHILSYVVVLEYKELCACPSDHFQISHYMFIFLKLSYFRYLGYFNVIIVYYGYVHIPKPIFSCLDHPLNFLIIGWLYPNF